MSKNTTDELVELVRQINFLLTGRYVSVNTTAIERAILDWHNKQVEEVLDRVEGLAELTESYRQGSRLACKNCGTETRGEFLVPAFQAIPLSTIQALRKELDGGQSDGVR